MWNVAVFAALVAACATTSEAPRRAGSGSLPGPETQKAVFELIQVSVICLKYNQPNQPGELVLKGVFLEPGSPAQVLDEKSTPGNERAIGCIVEQAGRVKSPGPQVVLYAIPLPFRAEDIRIYFAPSVAHR